MSTGSRVMIRIKNRCGKSPVIKWSLVISETGREYNRMFVKDAPKKCTMLIRVDLFLSLVCRIKTICMTYYT